MKSKINKSRVWAEISQSALLHNLEVVRSHVAKGTEIAAVIKANAYGHGAHIIAPPLEKKGGVKFFCVASLEEAIELREIGIKGDILILSSVQPQYVPELQYYNIICSLVDPDLIEPYAMLAAKGHQPLRLHLKLDTGMTRLGLPTREDKLEETVKAVSEIKNIPFLRLEGVFSHLASGIDDPEYSKYQLDRFNSFLDKYYDKHCLRHIAASSALTDPNYALDMVRAGIFLYGGYAPPESLWKELLPVMSVYSRVVEVQDCPKGTTVSYGRTWRAKRDTKLAVIDAGYADGINRLLSNRGTWMLHGQEVPIVGRVCMDRCLVDITDVPQVKRGDKALFFGEDEGKFLPARKQAEKAETIDYELFTGISERVPRIPVDIEVFV